METASPPKLPAEFARLFHEARQGSQEAARIIVERYGRAIRRAVRHLLHKKLRAKFDSCDFEQAVWASLFTGSGEVEDFASSTDAMKFLVRIARNKVVDEFRRRLQGAKYNLNRERSLDDPDAGPLNIAHTQPTPSQQAIAGEEWERMLAGQPSHYRRVMQLRLSGDTFEQIAAAEKLHERTARRVIQRMKVQSEREQEKLSD